MQPYELYNDSIILYSMGNWSFGGNSGPRDMDTAIVQITVEKALDGGISTKMLKIIPCCVSSRPVTEGYTGSGYNDYRPTPYEKDSEDYNRAMSKITGSYDGPDVNVDYSNWYASWG